MKDLQAYPISAKDLQSASPAAIVRTEYDDFPCSPYQIRNVIARDPVTGRDTILRTEYDWNMRPYDWAVCHAGSWIYRQHRYVWVAGTKRHHHCPVRWVKYGGTKAYVPLHPHDVAGKTPINLKHGVYQSADKKGDSVERVAFNSSTPVKVLNTAPKEFLKPYFPSLQHAETPRLEAHLVKDGFAPGKAGLGKDWRDCHHLRSQIAEHYAGHSGGAGWQKYYGDRTIGWPQRQLPRRKFGVEIGRQLLWRVFFRRRRFPRWRRWRRQLPWWWRIQRWWRRGRLPRWRWWWRWRSSGGGGHK